MEIVYLGHASFLLKSKLAKVVTDPFLKKVGFKFPKVEADLVTVSHDHFDHSNVEGVGGNPMVIQGPGEYEVKGVSVFGIQSFHDESQGKDRGKNTVYLIEAEEIRICHLGDLGTKLTDKQIELLDGVDVLMVPVGGNFSLDAATAWEITKQIGPSIVIPMLYKTKQHSKEFDKLAGVEEFVQQAGLEPRKENKLVVNKLSLAEETELVVLEKK